MTVEMAREILNLLIDNRMLVFWIVLIIMLAGSAITYWIATWWLGREKNPLTKTLVKLSAQIEAMNNREERATEERNQQAILIERMTGICDNLSACVKELHEK